MKKITTCIALVAFGSYIFAQKLDLRKQSINVTEKTEKTQKKQVKSTKDAFWSEDFDGGMPDDWSIVDLSEQNMPWYWGTETVKGAFTDVRPDEILSTTPENGFMWICPDGFNSIPQYGSYLDDPPAIAVPDEALVEMDSYIETGPIDLSEASGTVLEFYQQMRVYIDFFSEIWVSNDYDPANPDLAHWSTWVTHNLPAENMFLEEFHQINMTEVAAGESEVYIRIYGYGATHYYWIIDDMQIIEPLDNNLLVNDSWLFYDWFEEDPSETGYDISGDLQHGGGYYKIPIVQVKPYIGAKVAAENFGVNGQNAVTLKTEIYHKDDSAALDSTLVYSHESDPYVFEAFVLDTLTDIFPDGGYTPDQWGHYEVHMTVLMENPDDYPIDNKAHFDFEIGDSSYTRTRDSVTDIASTGLIIGGGTDGDGLGHFYRLIQPVTEVERMRFYFAQRNENFPDLINGGNFTALAKIFAYNEAEEDWQNSALVTSNIWTATLDDTSTYITLDFVKDGANEWLPAGDYCLFLETYTSVDEGDDINNPVGFWIGCDNDIKQPLYTAINNLSGDWGWMRNANYILDLVHAAEDWDTATSVSDPVAIEQKALQLAQNYPNPAINKTDIKYVILNPANITLRIFDLTGKVVIDLEEGFKPAGRNTIEVNVQDMEVGVYYYTLKAGQYESTRKMVIMD